MRSLFGICLSGAILALALGCGKKDGTTASGGGTASLEGTYLITGIEMGGEKLPDEFITKGPEEERTVKFSGDKMIVMKMKKEESMSVKYDTSKNPPHITTTEMKNGKTEMGFGIYKIEGDVLTVCTVEGDDVKEADRPKEFKTSKDSKAILMTLKKK